MTKEQAINYMKSSGFSSEVILEITMALTSKEELLDFAYMIDNVNDRIDFVFSDGTQKHCRIGKLKGMTEKYRRDYGCTEIDGDTNKWIGAEVLLKIISEITEEAKGPMNENRPGLYKALQIINKYTTEIEV